MTTAQPHDNLFHLVFGHAERARRALEDFLGPDLAAHIRWDTVRREEASFVDPSLDPAHADLLFSAELQGGGGVLLYILWEHQRSPQPKMPLRLLDYMLRIWAAFGSPQEPLPVVVPVVLYNGRRPWTAPRTLGELLVAESRRLPQVVPDFVYLLADLSTRGDDSLPQDPAVRMTLLMMKYAGARAFWRRFLTWIPLFADVRAGADGDAITRALWAYAEKVTSDEPPREVYVGLEAAMGAQAREVFEGWGDRVRREAREEGVREGLREGQRVTLVALLRARFGELPSWAADRVGNATVAELEAYALRVLAAETLEAALDVPSNEP